MRAHMSLLGAVAFALLAVDAGADGLEAARAAFHDGRFLEAADLAEAEASADGLALAAESLTVEGYFRAPEDQHQPLLSRAVALAGRAIEIDPANPQAHLQSAHAMGRYAQTIGVLEALNEGYASRIRAALDQALALDPDLVAAHLSLGAWHAEIVATLGLMAGMVYGASEDEALAHYERALALAPASAAANLEYAIGLLTLDDDEETVARARARLEHALAAPVEDAFGEIVHERAARRLAQLDGR